MPNIKPIHELSPANRERPRSITSLRKRAALDLEPDPYNDPIAWHKWWMRRNAGKTWTEAQAAWYARVA